MSGLVGASLGLALGGLAGCGDDLGSNDCKVTRTCRAVETAGAAGQTSSLDSGGAPDASNGGAAVTDGPGGDRSGGASVAEGGAGAAAGVAGAAGAPVAVVPDCTSDADCDDKLACNGVEKCDVDGHCAAGAAPECANADEANCSVACVEGAGKYECVVTANDTDGDGHASALCKATPGDDCDDAQASVFTGAPELCDRLDNDCDKKVDLADGLKFSGESHWVGRDVDSTIRAESAVVAWSDAANLYGLFWKVRGTTDLVVALYDANGVRKAGPTTVGHSAHARLAIGAGAAGFGIVWNSDSEQTTEFRSVSAQGALGEQVSLTKRVGVGYAPLALAWSDSAKRWEVVADHGVASVSAAGVGTAFVSRLAASLSIDSLEIVATGKSFVLGVSGTVDDVATPLVHRYPANSTVGVVKDHLTFDNPNKASGVHLAARADGSFAVVVPAFTPSFEKRTSHVTAFDATGKRKCGYVEPEFVSGLTGTASGYTLVRVAAIAASSFRELSDSCEAGMLVPTGFPYPYSPSVTASPSSYFNLWTDDDSNSFYSVFGANYCN